MAATVGWHNKQLQRSGGNVVAKRRGRRGGGKAQKQPREKTTKR